MPDRFISVRVPADARYVRIVRMVANRSASTAGFAFDRIEDLTLAIDEAAAELLEIGGGATIDGVLASEPDGIHVSLGIDAAVASWPPAGWNDSLRATVLNAVAGEIGFDKTADSSTVRFVVG